LADRFARGIGVALVTGVALSPRQQVMDNIRYPPVAVNPLQCCAPSVFVCAIELSVENLVLAISWWWWWWVVVVVVVV
jgi:hypothetical protein